MMSNKNSDTEVPVLEFGIRLFTGDNDVWKSCPQDLQLQPAYGVDVLRWWVAQCGLDVKVYIGPTVLNKCLDQLFKVSGQLT